MKSAFLMLAAILSLTACHSSHEKCDMETVIDKHNGILKVGVENNSGRVIQVRRTSSLVSDNAWFEVRSEGKFVSLGMADTILGAKPGELITLKPSKRVIFLSIKEESLLEKNGFVRGCHPYEIRYHFISSESQHKVACPIVMKICAS